MSEKKNYAIENPREIFTIFSGQAESRVTMAVECHMNPARTQDEISPQVCFGKFSRLVFSMISSGNHVKANINFDEIPDIIERTSFARNKVYEYELGGSAAAATLPETNAVGAELAYTTTFTMGPFKGRTPADVVLESPEGNREKLREQYDFLKSNADKYPRNRKIMEAITNAYDLYSAGKLEKKDSMPVPKAGGTAFEIYKSGYRPQTRDKREDGKCRIWEMNVQCNIGNRYPIELTISEYFAPVTDVNGRLNVQAAATDKSSIQKITAYMAMKDWNCLLSKFQEQKAMFIAKYGPKLLEEAEALYSAKFQRQAG